MTAYTVKIVEQDGMGSFDVIRTIPKAAFSSPPTRVLNGMGSCGLQFSRDNSDDDAALADLSTNWLKREVQVYRGASTDPIWWGVPMGPSKSVGSPVVTVQCAEVIPWLLSRRNFGKTNRTNLLANPQFESGAFTPWTTSGVDTAVVTTADSVLGVYSADLTEASVAPDASVQQTFSLHTGSIGDVVVFAGWYKVVTFTGPAIGNRGLYAEWRLAGAFKDARYSPIDGGTKTGKWLRAQIPPDSDPNKALWIPPNLDVTVNVRGYVVQGQARWDAMFAGLMESTSTLPSGDDIATFFAAVVNHASDGAYEKDDLDITVSASATGYKVTMSFQHVEHANIWADGIKQLIEREDGIDIGYSYTATTRTITAYDRTNGALGKGANRTGLDLSIGGTYLADYGWNRDGNRAANYLTVLGDGNGPSREEGGYTDNTKFGGRNMETVQAAPTGSSINSLTARANKIGRVVANPGVVDLVLRPGLLIEGATTLDVGDRVSLPAYDGFVDAGLYRVVDWSLNPNTDVLTVGVAPGEPGLS